MKFPKRKGNTYERDIAKVLSKAFGVHFNRVPTSGALYTTGRLKQLVGDVITEELDFPFSIECKSYKDWHIEDLMFNKKSNLHKFIAQCEKESVAKNGFFMLFVKKNGNKQMLISNVSINAFKFCFKLNNKTYFIYEINKDNLVNLYDAIK